MKNIFLLGGILAVFQVAVFALELPGSSPSSGSGMKPGAVKAATVSKEAQPMPPPSNQVSGMIKPEFYIISPGDKLSYRVDEDREDQRIIPVSIAGELEVPYLGRVEVAGKTLSQASRDIKSLLERQLYYQATVRLSVEEARLSTTQIKPKTITVVGQVRNQGPQPMPFDEKFMISRAILQAGGFGGFANGRKVTIIRKMADGKTDKLIVDVLSVIKDGKLENDVELQPDDMILVPEKIFNF